MAQGSLFSFGTPSSAQYNTTAGKSKGGTMQYAKGSDNHIWASGLSPTQIWSLMVAVMGGFGEKDFLSSFAETFGSNGKVAMGVQEIDNDFWEYRELDRRRKAVEVDSTTAVGSQTIDVTTTLDFRMFQTYDIVQIATYPVIQARVEASVMTGGVNVITLRKLSNTNWLAGEISTGDFIARLTSAHGEASEGVESFNRYPTIRQAYTQILRVGTSYTDKAAFAKIPIDLGTEDKGVSFYIDAGMRDMFQDLREQVENMMFWQEPAATGQGYQTSEGIFQAINNKAQVSINYATAVDEADFQAFFRAMNLRNNVNRWMFLGGYGFNEGVQNSLQPYLADGAAVYANFDGSDRLRVLKKEIEVGFNIAGYNYMNKLISFKHYRNFDDITTTGYKGAASATVFNGTDMALAFPYQPVDSTVASGVKASNGQALAPIMKLVRKERELVVGYIRGMTGVGRKLGLDSLSPIGASAARGMAEVVQTAVAKDEVHLLAECGVAVIAPELLTGFLRRTS